MNDFAKRQRRRSATIEGPLFEGDWNVIVGGESTPSNRIRIEAAGGGEYDLKYLDPLTGGWSFLQKLVYMPDTCTLENLVDDEGKPPLLPGSEEREPQRCISFWNCAVRNRHDCCAISAIRIGKNPPQPGKLLPPFEQGDKGAWGAEEG